jgi:putative transposase
MKKSRFTESQIISILKEGELGIPVSDILRNHGISRPTYYNWKSKYGGLNTSQLKRLKELETENTKLKQLYANASLETMALKELIEKKL